MGKGQRLPTLHSIWITLALLGPIIASTSTMAQTTTSIQSTTTTTTTTTIPPPTLVLPHKMYFTQLANRTSRRTGFALFNQNELPMTLRLTAYDNNGNQLRTAGGAFANPVVLPLVSGAQLARSASESDIFNVGLGNPNGWFLAECDRPGLVGFYLLYSDALTVMDGTDVSDKLYSQMILPEVRGAEIALVNPGSGSSTATINLMSDRGAQIGKSATISLATHGRYSGVVTGLFPPADVALAGYLSISCTSPLAASELLGTADATLMALNPLDPTLGEKTLYSPQYAVGGGIYQTAVVVINLEDVATQVEFSLWGDKGSPLGQPTSLDLPAKGRVVFANPALLGINPAGPLVEGYLRIRSSASRIDGFVSFGDARNTQFQTAIPLAYQGRDRMVYSQVAQNDLFFTGLAVVNPRAESVDLFLSLFNTDGLRVGVGSASIPPGGRISRLLTDLFPGMQPMSRGYFKVLASRPVLSFGVFGTRDLSVLSAIIPQ